MNIYSLPIKSVKCTLNFSFKLIFSGFFVSLCFLVLLTRPLRRVNIKAFLETTVYHLYERREREESCVLSFQWQ